MSNESNIPANIDPERYGTLCEYVFGELSEEHRAAFERELAADPALAAERERLEATIGFVQDTLPADELPADMRATLRAAAAKVADPAGSAPATSTASGGAAPHGLRLLPRLVRLTGTPARAAAACLLLLGAGFALRALLTDPAALGPADPVALVDESKSADRNRAYPRAPEGQSRLQAPASEAMDQEELGALRSLGYVGEEADELGAHLEVSEPSVALLREAEKLQEGLGYAGGRRDQDVASAARRSGVLDELRAAAPEPAKKRENELAAGKDGFFLGRGAKERQEGERPVAGAVVTDSSLFDAADDAEAPQDLIVIHANRAAAADNEPAPVLRDAARAKGKFKGPGDTVPPGGGEVAAAPVSPAPTSVEPTAPGEAQRLKAIGYVEYEGDMEEEAEDAPTDFEQLAALGYEGSFAPSPAEGEGDEREANRSTRRPVLSPEEILVYTDNLLRSCEIQPAETPAMMFFRCWGAHPFQRTADDNLSTFAVDVDTASYTLARRYLQSGRLPAREQVRTEEFVNYFRADRAAPEDGVFAIGLESAPSLFNGDPNVEMLRVTVRGRDVDAFDRQPLALTFVIDVSGSMDDGGRIELVKESLALLLTQLDPSDSIALIKFSTSATVVSPMVSAANRGSVEDAIVALRTSGGTNIESGLLAGFELAASELTRNAVNRVILLSDGVGNIGDTEQKSLLAKVASYRDLGIYLNTIGVGMGNHDDAFLEQLADKGDGLCQYIDSKAEAEKALVHEFTKTLQPIARDVKIQVEFDPTQVESYRQLGYENRVIADADFRQNAVDAGEVNAGHQVTALYELVRTGSGRRASASPLATVRVRYKPPFAVDQGALGKRATADAEVAQEIERGMAPSDFVMAFDVASEGYRRAVLVAQFAELLRQSVHTEDDSLETFELHVMKLVEQAGDPETVEFADLVARALPFFRDQAEDEEDELRSLIHELCRLEYEAGVREQMAEREGAEPPDPDVARAFEQELESVRTQIRELLARRHGEPVEPLEGEALRRLEDLGYSDR